MRDLLTKLRPLFILVVCSGLCSSRSVRSASFSWGYGEDNGPAVWAEHYELCSGQSQSPVDLPAPGGNNPAAETFTLGDAWTAGGKDLEILNNGHTIQVNLPTGMEVSGGGLPSGADYTAAQFHFHWGANPSTGSEHTVLNKHMPLEMHVVLWDQNLGSFDTAKITKDGLAVLGFFFQLGEENGPFEPVAEALEHVEHSDSDAVVDDMDLLALVQEAMQGGYYRYSGSLTTPTCNEGVVWTNFMKAITISANQLRGFTEATGHEGPLVNNFRNTQPLNGREVTQYGSP